MKGIEATETLATNSAKFQKANGEKVKIVGNSSKPPKPGLPESSLRPTVTPTCGPFVSAGKAFWRFLTFRGPPAFLKN